MDYTPASEVEVTEEHLQNARSLGLDHGRAVASWNEQPELTLQAIRDVDPMIVDLLPSPLSGEFADSFTIDGLLRDLDLPVYVDDTCAAYEDLIEKYEEGWNEAYEQELTERAGE